MFRGEIVFLVFLYKQVINYTQTLSDSRKPRNLEYTEYTEYTKYEEYTNFW